MNIDVTTKETYTVSEYLDALNKDLRTKEAKITGEVSGIQEYPGRSYLYFSIKDTKDASTVKCFMWKREYTLSGVKLEEGMEVVISAYPNIYKPNGGMTLQVEEVSLVGEGALKIAYDKLKAQLEKEGLFSPSRKRALPAFPHRIGVLTSKSGAVINDFLSNIGHFGFEIIFVDTKVEGEGAIKDLLGGLRTLYKQDLDVLVVMRGGGSLESFQAFNNETIVRAISKFNVPVITGIGHDKDAPLVSLVSDINVSTPTAVANLITNSWRDAIHAVNLAEQKIFVSFESLLRDNMFLVDHARELLEETFRNIFESFRTSTNRFLEHAVRFEHHVKQMYTTIGQFGESLELLFTRLMRRVEEQLMFTEKHIAQGNPERQLKLGWSIIKNKEGGIVRSVKDVSQHEQIDVVVTDGTIHTKVL